jgi:hypothetical protein
MAKKPYAYTVGAVIAWFTYNGELINWITAILMGVKTEGLEKHVIVVWDETVEGKTLGKADEAARKLQAWLDEVETPRVAAERGINLKLETGGGSLKTVYHWMADQERVRD